MSNMTILKTIEEQLKGEIYDVLTPKNKYYQLIVHTGVLTPNYQNYKIPMPDPKTALIAIDMICEIFKGLNYDKHCFYFQYRNDINEEWEDWEDERGFVLTEYIIDDNFNLYSPDDGE